MKCLSLCRSNLSQKNRNIKQIHEILIDNLSLNLFTHSETKLLLIGKVNSKMVILDFSETHVSFNMDL